MRTVDLMGDKGAGVAGDTCRVTAHQSALLRLDDEAMKANDRVVQMQCRPIRMEGVRSLVDPSTIGEDLRREGERCRCAPDFLGEVRPPDLSFGEGSENPPVQRPIRQRWIPVHQNAALAEQR